MEMAINIDVVLWPMGWPRTPRGTGKLEKLGRGTAEACSKLFGADLPNRLSSAILGISSRHSGCPRRRTEFLETQTRPRDGVAA